MRYFDTSLFCCYGRSELPIGHALRQGPAHDQNRPRCAPLLAGEAPPAELRANGLSGLVQDGAPYDYVAAAPPDILARARRVEAVCGGHGVPLPAAALQLVLAHPGVCSVIPGALTRGEVEQNIAHLREPIPAALWTDLKSEGLLHPTAPVPG